MARQTPGAQKRATGDFEKSLDDTPFTFLRKSVLVCDQQTLNCELDVPEMWNYCLKEITIVCQVVNFSHLHLDNRLDQLRKAHDIIVLSGNQVSVLFAPVEPMMVTS